MNLAKKTTIDDIIARMKKKESVNDALRILMQRYAVMLVPIQMDAKNMQSNTGYMKAAKRYDDGTLFMERSNNQSYGGSCEFTIHRDGDQYTYQFAPINYATRKSRSARQGSP
jgi:hypothetical protein